MRRCWRQVMSNAAGSWVGKGDGPGETACAPVHPGGVRGTPTSRAGLFNLLCVSALWTVCISCATLPVAGEFYSQGLQERDPTRTILIIFNHGYSQDRATTFKPGFPPILRMAADQSDDLVLFSQVRNMAGLQRDDHRRFIEAAVAWFHHQHKIPVEQIILAGQSCGGWGALEAAAWTYPHIGGVIAFAPICHGRSFQQSTWGETQQYQGIGELARLLRSPTLIFLYEGDSFYNLTAWKAFEARVSASPQIHVVTLDKAMVLQVCPRCTRDSHGAAYTPAFARAYLDPHVRAVINAVRARLRERQGSP
jgi:dienelactone hydrolase